MCQEIILKKVGGGSAFYLPLMTTRIRNVGYAVNRFCGENLAIFAASPSVMLILGFWESDVLGDEVMRDDPFNWAI